MAKSRVFCWSPILPYNIATPIISNLLHEITRRPTAMVVTIQKELADRMIASPGTKDYGALSVWIQSLCDVEIVRVLATKGFLAASQCSLRNLRLDTVPQWRERLLTSITSIKRCEHCSFIAANSCAASWSAP